MAKLIPVKISLDSADAERKISKINTMVRNLGSTKAEVPIGMSAKQFAQVEKNLKGVTVLQNAEARKQVNAALQAEKRITDAHKSTLKVFEASESAKTRMAQAQANERSKLRLLEARKADRAEQESLRRQAAVHRAALKSVENQERAKTRMKELEFRKQERLEAQSFRRREAEMRRDHQEFQRAERAKTQMLAAQENARARIRQNAQQIGRGIQSTGIAITAATTLPIALAMREVIEIGREYEVSMNVFQAVTQASEEQMRSAAEQAIKLGKDITLPGTSAADAARAMVELSKGGLSVADAIAASDGAIRLSRAAMIEGADAAFIIASALNQFQLQGKDATRVADLFAAAANSAAGGPVELAEALKNVGPVAATMNNKIEDTITLLAVLAKNGILGGDAGTGLKVVLTNLAAPAKKGAEALKTLGINVYDSAGQMKPAIQIMKEVADATRGMTDEQKFPLLKDLFGKIGIKSALPILKAGSDQIDKMAEKVTKANAATELAAARTRGLTGAWEAMKSQLETGALLIFEDLKTPLTNALTLASDAIDRIVGFYQSLPEGARQAILGLTALVAAIGPVITVIGAIVVAWGAFTAAVAAVGGFTVVATAIGVVSGLLVGLGAFIAEVTVVVAVFKKAWDINFGGIQDIVQRAITNVKLIIGTTLTAIKAVVGTILGEILRFWENNQDTILDTVETVSNAIKAVWSAFFSTAEGLWSKHGESIMAIVRTWTDFVLNIIQLSWRTAGDILRVAMNLINGDTEKAWEAFLDVIRNGNEIAVRLTRYLFEQVINIVKFSIPLILDLITYLATEAVRRSKDMVVWVVTTINELPFLLISLIPKFVAAGAQIGQAIWEGIKRGLSDSVSASGSLGLSEPSVGGSLGLAIGSGLDLPSLGGGTPGGGGGRSRGGGSRGRGSGTPKLSELEELRKRAKEAAQSVQFLNSSMEVLDLKLQILDSGEMESAINKLIQLRQETGMNRALALPVGDNPKETLNLLNTEIKALEDWQAAQDKIEQRAKDTEAALEALNLQHTDNVLNIAEEIRLLGIKDPLDRLAIENEFKLLRLREEGRRKGLSEPQLNAIEKSAAEYQKEYEQRVKILETRKAEIDAAEKYADVLSDLDQKMSGNAQTSEYERVQVLLTTEAYKNLNDEQRANLELKAKMVDFSTIERGLKAEWDAVRGLSHDTSTYDKVLRELDTTYRDLDQTQKDYLLGMAKQIDEVRRLKEIYADTFDFVRGMLQDLSDEGFGGFFRNLADKFKSKALDLGASLITDTLFNIFGVDVGQLFGKTDNPVAKPIVGEIEKSNTILKEIRDGINGITNAAGGSGSGSSGLRSVLSGLPGIAGQIGGGLGGVLQILGIGGNSGSRQVSESDSTNLSTQVNGGLFKKGLSEAFNSENRNNTIAGLLGITGSAVGGRFGGILSSIGGGISTVSSLGSMLGISALGGPIGLAIGAAVGLVTAAFGGLFGSPKRKRDKNEKMPALNQSIAQALSDLRTILSDTKTLRMDPFEAIRAADDIRAQIQSGFGIQFESSKYRRIARDRIAGALSQADPIINEIKAAAEVSKSAGERDRRLVAEFAGGVFLRRNGMLPGTFTGRDTLPSILAPGEMVLNPSQIAAVRRNSGSTDPFSGAGIPGYAGGGFIGSPSLAGYDSSPITIQINVTNTGMVETDVEAVVESAINKPRIYTQIAKNSKKAGSRGEL